MNELSGKAITLKINNLDSNYSNFYLYYTREFSDTQGYSMSEAKLLTKPYSYGSNSIDIIITGTELETSVSEEDLNITYHTINEAETITQQSDRLFVGNVKFAEEEYKELKQLSLDGVLVQLVKSDTIVVLPPSVPSAETYGYSDPEHIYNDVGY